MGRGLIKALIGYEDEAAEKLPETRGESNALGYELADVVKSAQAVFYFQHPSMLNFQQEMERKQKRSNLQTLFGVKKIPCTEQIKQLVDEMEPARFASVFDKSRELARREGILEKFQVLGGLTPVALDGVWYFSSEKIHCKHCLTMTKKGKTTYYHDMMAAVIVHPDSPVVLPLFPEFIRNEDGTEKQDCERNAAKRYLKEQGGKLKELNAVILGDDLYACHSICKEITGQGMHFVFTCKDDSAYMPRHKWIAEQVKDAGETCKQVKWNGRNHLEHRYRWVNGVENRCDGEKMRVNYLDFEIWNVERKKSAYHNSWITDIAIDGNNAAELARTGRCRWKIENEHNNVLKHHGYNLQHNAQTMFATGTGKTTRARYSAC